VVLLIDKPYAPTFVLNCLTANVASIVDKKLVQANEKNGDWATAGSRPTTPAPAR
jgi:peptide/nickel transport system substrate-binding protein